VLSEGVASHLIFTSQLMVWMGGLVFCREGVDGWWHTCLTFRRGFWWAGELVKGLFHACGQGFGRSCDIEDWMNGDGEAGILGSVPWLWTLCYRRLLSRPLLVQKQTIACMLPGRRHL
jgi:hypothetical protein